MRACCPRVLWSIVLSVGSLLFVSCSEQASGQRPVTRSGDSERTPAKPVVPPAVSIGEALPELDLTAGRQPASAAGKVFAAAAEEPEEPDDADETVAEPDPGTPEWLIREITRIQSAPIDAVRTPVPGSPGEFKVVELTEKQVQDEEMRRAEKIISLALEVCAKTKDSADRALLFNNAVHYLAGARVTLAAYGDHDQVRLLGEEADMLYKRDPKSFGAVELQMRLVECLAELAEQEGRNNDSWAGMAAKQARLFASRFPQDTNRCALSLVLAARASEVAGRFEDAKYCFGVLARDFAKTPFAEQAAGAIRRYQLAGQPLGEFAGPTIDGGFLSLEQLRGQPVLIVFWSAESPTFREDLPRLKKLIGSRSEQSLTVVGVNMDLDEATVDRFMEQSDLSWRTIFYSNPEQRGIKNPLARAFGVTTVPQYWLIDSRGVVTAAPVDLRSLSTTLGQTAGKDESTIRR